MSDASHAPSGVNTVPVKKDAKNRAIRTFIQNIGLDVAVVVLPLIYDAVSGWNGGFDAAYWTLVSTSVGKTAALTVIAYFMRKASPPVGANR